jgi:hypothetical protein
VEATPLADMIRVVGSGPANMVEWYFPARLFLDAAAASTADVDEDGYLVEHGIRAHDGPTSEMPVLAIATEVATPEAYGVVRDRRRGQVGAGRPRAGTDLRGDGFRIVHVPALTHMDAVVAPDTDANPIPSEIERFAFENTR